MIYSRIQRTNYLFIECLIAKFDLPNYFNGTTPTTNLCVKYPFRRNYHHFTAFYLITDIIDDPENLKWTTNRAKSRASRWERERAEVRGYKVASNRVTPNPENQIRSTEITTVSRKSCGRACSRECKFEYSCYACLPRIIYRMGDIRRLSNW